MILGLTLAIAGLTPAIAADGTCSASARTVAHSESTSTIVETAVAAGDFNSLVAAVKAAGLAETLSGRGPFTVFAPTDAAFAKLPAKTLRHLLSPEGKEQLAQILTYHVVAGELLAKDVVEVTGATTVGGQRVDIKVDGKKVMLDGATVLRTDIDCSNGVIHVIDTVLMPATKDVVETAAAADSFRTLLAAAKAAGLVEALKGEGPITVFAPTDDAFAALPEGTVANLLKPENKEALASILKLHVVSGRIYSDAAVEAGEAMTLAGRKIQITERSGTVLVNGARVLTANLDTSNGVIHVIDAVLLPASN